MAIKGCNETEALAFQKVKPLKEIWLGD